MHHGTALFVEAAREKEFPTVDGGPSTPGWRAEPPVRDEAWGVAGLRCTAHLAILPIFFPQLDLGAYHTCRPAEDPGRVAYQRRWPRAIR